MASESTNDDTPAAPPAPETARTEAEAIEEAAAAAAAAAATTAGKEQAAREEEKEMEQTGKAAEQDQHEEPDEKDGEKVTSPSAQDGGVLPVPGGGASGNGTGQNPPATDVEDATSSNPLPDGGQQQQPTAPIQNATPTAQPPNNARQPQPPNVPQGRRQPHQVQAAQRPSNDDLMVMTLATGNWAPSPYTRLPNREQVRAFRYPSALNGRAVWHDPRQREHLSNLANMSGRAVNLWYAFVDQAKQLSALAHARREPAPWLGVLRQQQHGSDLAAADGEPSQVQDLRDRQPEGTAIDQPVATTGVRPQLIPISTVDGKFEIDVTTLEADEALTDEERVRLRGKTLHIRRFIHRDANVQAHFLMNHDFENLSINLSTHQKGSVIGYLPDCSIIQIEGCLPVIFFGSLGPKVAVQAATPGSGPPNDKKRKNPMSGPGNPPGSSLPPSKKPNGGHPDSAGPSIPQVQHSAVNAPANPFSNLSPKSKAEYIRKIKSVTDLKGQQLRDPSPPGSDSKEGTDNEDGPTTGKEGGLLRRKLLRRLARHNRQRERKRKANVEFASVKSLKDMEHTVVMHAIACVWHTLYQQGTRFGYAHELVYTTQNREAPEDYQLVCPGDRGFIMPLWVRMHPQDDIGHLVLATAHRRQPSVGPSITFHDSMHNDPSSDLRGVIRREAHRVIKKSKWLDRCGKGEQKDPYYRYVKFPRQVLVNTCGFFTILNAWAVILDIPLHPNNGRRRVVDGFFDDKVFIAEGLELVNLALAGCLSTSTIRLFMAAHGYSAAPPKGTAVRTVTSHKIERLTFNEYLASLQEQNRLGLRETWGREVPVEMIQTWHDMVAQLKTMACPHLIPEVGKALLAAEGDYEYAFRIVMSKDPAAKSQSPNGSLSSGGSTTIDTALAGGEATNPEEENHS